MGVDRFGPPQHMEHGEVLVFDCVNEGNVERFRCKVPRAVGLVVGGRKRGEISLRRTASHRTRRRSEKGPEGSS